MDNLDLEKLLSIIDKRVNKAIKENKLLKRYSAEIVEVNTIVDDDTDDTTETLIIYKVRLFNQTDKKSFVSFTEKSNKTGTALKKGDKVSIQTIGNDLNTGIILYKL